MEKLACAIALVLNQSGEPWNAMDEANLTVAKTRCEELDKRAPCLLKFVKVATLTYHGICGEKQ